MFHKYNANEARQTHLHRWIFLLNRLFSEVGRRRSVCSNVSKYKTQTKRKANTSALKHRYNIIAEQLTLNKNSRRQYNGNTVKIHFSFGEGRCVLMAAWGHSYYIRPAVIKDPANKPREMSPKVPKMKSLPIAITSIENICPDDIKKNILPFLPSLVVIGLFVCSLWRCLTVKEGKTTILSFPLVCSSLKYFSCSHMKENLTLFTYDLYWAHKLSFSPLPGPRCPKSEVTCQFWASAASRESERGTNAEANINWTRQLLSSNTNTQHKYNKTNTTQIYKFRGKH